MKWLFVQKFIFRYVSVCDVAGCTGSEHGCCFHLSADCAIWYPCLRCPARDYQIQTQLVHPKEHTENTYSYVYSGNVEFVLK